LSFLLLLKNSEPETHGWAVAELKQTKTKLPNRARLLYGVEPNNKY